MKTVTSNIRPDYDAILQTIADYVLDYEITSDEAYKTARYDLIDSMACAMLALQHSACTKMLGPIVPGAELSNGTGVPVPGTKFQLDPVKAAFDIGALIRWLDFNDTWLAAEWGHPSDNLGAILAVADYVTRCANNGESSHKYKALTMRDVLTAMIKAHEIQGVLALDNSFNRVGLDHVVLVKVASAAVAMQMLGGDRDAILRVLSQAWVDGQSLRTYRHAPNAGSRKSWAAGDATSRAVRLAFITQSGEMGYPSALTAEGWGFYDVAFKGNKFSLQRPLGSYVMENVLFKISFPAEFHSQTAVEAAVKLHDIVKAKAGSFDSISKINIKTHESAIRIISKSGELHNPADRDHCLQYMIAVGLLEGDLRAEHYDDAYALQANNKAMLDSLRDKMQVEENIEFSRDYLDPEKRSIANSLQIEFNDGSLSEESCIEYPIGHRRRRKDGIPVLINKFESALDAVVNNGIFSAEQRDNIIAMFGEVVGVSDNKDDVERGASNKFDELPIDKFMDVWRG